MAAYRRANDFKDWRAACVDLYAITKRAYLREDVLQPELVVSNFY